MFRFLEMIPLLLGLTLAPALPGVELSPAPTPEVPIVTPAPESNTSLSILMYHDFVTEGEPCGPWAVTDTRFREDLRWLSEHGYTFVLPSDLVSGQPLPEKAVMITIDDGYVSNYTIAAPILEELDAKAVISLIVDRRDSGYSNAMTWDMCRELAASGRIEFGSHTYNAHEEGAWLQRLDGEDQEAYEERVFPDVLKSIQRIEEELGTTVQFFAYPQGRTDPWSDRFIEEHFSVSVTTQAHTADLSQGLYKLPRYNVSMDVSPAQILPE